MNPPGKAPPKQFGSKPLGMQTQKPANSQASTQMPKGRRASQVVEDRNNWTPELAKIRQGYKLQETLAQDLEDRYKLDEQNFLLDNKHPRGENEEPLVLKGDNNPESKLPQLTQPQHKTQHSTASGWAEARGNAIVGRQYANQHNNPYGKKGAVRHNGFERWEMGNYTAACQRVEYHGIHGYNPGEEKAETLPAIPTCHVGEDGFTQQMPSKARKRGKRFGPDGRQTG